MMLQPLLSLTLGLEAILVVRTLVLIALVPPLVRMLPGAKAPTGPQPAQQIRRPEGHDIALSLGSSWIFALGGAVVIQADLAFNLNLLLEILQLHADHAIEAVIPRAEITKAGAASAWHGAPRRRVMN